MMSKTLQALGALALLAWTATGLVLWMEVKSNVTVTVEETNSDQSNESALLAERMSMLSGDLDELVMALEGNFALVARAIGDGANQNAVRAAVIEERLADLEQALPHALEARETAGALSTALAQVEAMRALPVGQAGPAAQEHSDTPQLAVAEISSPEPEEPAAIEQKPEPRVVEESTPAPPTSFLAFKLPSRDFQFEGTQNFEVLGDLSRVGFDAKSTLHDFSGVSNNVSGNFKVDLARPEDGISGKVAIRTKSLDTGLEGRDEAMLEHLNSEQNPNIEFVFESFKLGSMDRKAKQLDGTISGKMTINGTTQSLAMKVKVHVDESRRLVVEGEAPLSRADYNVEIPGKLGVISTEDEVRIWIHLRSRAKTGVTQ